MNPEALRALSFSLEPLPLALGAVPSRGRAPNAVAHGDARLAAGNA